MSRELVYIYLDTGVPRPVADSLDSILSSIPGVRSYRVGRRDRSAFLTGFGVSTDFIRQQIERSGRRVHYCVKTATESFPTDWIIDIVGRASQNYFSTGHN